MADSDVKALNATMKKAASALLEGGVPFAVAGGLAVWIRGGPETTHDVDFLIKPEDKDSVLEFMQHAGMRVEKSDDDWLYKAFDGELMIDFIFRVPDHKAEEFIDRADTMSVDGLMLPVLSVADFFIMKLCAMREDYADYSGLFDIARQVDSPIDWQQVRAWTEGNPFAEAYFHMCSRLGIATD